MEKFKFITEIELADVNGEQISEGSILKNIKDGDIGVVVRIIRENDKYFPIYSAIGDVHIQLDYGYVRITNNYSEWVHTKSNEQKFIHRYLSWQSKKFQADDWDDKRVDIQWAINGIVSLIPPESIDWEMGLGQIIVWKMH